MGKISRNELTPELQQELTDVFNYVDGTDAQALGDHLASTANPHQVTKAQVGLGSVDDVKQAPYTHLSDTSNPHSVTASQVGAPPVSRTISPGTGLSGGGALSSNLLLSLDLNYSDNRYLLKSEKADDSNRLDGLSSGSFMKHGDTYLQMGNNDGILFDDLDQPGEFYFKIDGDNRRAYHSGNITFGTGAPSGGKHGDIYIQY